MEKRSIHFLFENSEEKNDIVRFLNPFFNIAEESIPFSMDGIKTKQLYSQVEQRQAAASFEFLLLQYGDSLQVFDSEKRRIHIDFDNDKLNYSRKIVAKDPFLRAIGKDRRNVLDVSAGLAIDAIFLAQHGHDVIAVERNPLLYVLLNYAHKKSKKLAGWNIKFEFADAVDYILKMEKGKVDCLYFDPMFPDRVKSALPKQEMVLFRRLVGQDDDAKFILENLLKMGTRVVVKRPSYAPPIGFRPTNAFESKLIRFDIY